MEQIQDIMGKAERDYDLQKQLEEVDFSLPTEKERWEDYKRSMTQRKERFQKVKI